ncbi:MAG: hypothetical protein ABW032_05580 [Burkholderiaceae bacterium]
MTLPTASTPLLARDVDDSPRSPTEPPRNYQSTPLGPGRDRAGLPESWSAANAGETDVATQGRSFWAVSRLRGRSEASVTVDVPRMPEDQALGRERAEFIRRVFKALGGEAAPGRKCALSGVVRRGEDGHLTSKNPGWNVMLSLFEVLDPVGAAAVRIGKNGVRLSLHVDIAALLAFDEGCKVRELDVPDAPGGKLPLQDGKVIDLTGFTSRRVVKLGQRAFESGAVHEATIAEEAQPGGERALVKVRGGHPGAYLRDLPARLESESTALVAFVNGGLAAKHRAVHEMRERMGGQFSAHFKRQQRFDWPLVITLALSLFVAGGLAYALDVVFLEWLVASLVQLAKNLHANHRVLSSVVHGSAKVAEVAVPTLTPLLAETLDSASVKRIGSRLRGGPLLPQSKEEAMENLEEAWKAGKIAAVGSVLFNLAQLSPTAASAVLILLIFNPIATATSGAVAASDVEQSRDQMGAGYLQGVRNRYFRPSGVHRALPPAQASREETRGAIGVERGAREMISSMGSGQAFSAMAYIVTKVLIATGKLSPKAELVEEVGVNAPTEVENLALCILAARFVGLPAWAAKLLSRLLVRWMAANSMLTTDNQKNELMIAAIADAAKTRYLDDPRGEGETVEIAEETMGSIEHPSLEFAFPAGEKVIQWIDQSAEFFAWAVHALRGQEPEIPLTLEQKMVDDELVVRMGGIIEV